MTTCAAEASAWSTFPIWAATAVFVCPAESSCRIWLQRFPLPGRVGSVAHLTFSWAAAWIAYHSFEATTPRKLFLRTTLAPGMWLIELASIEMICGAVPSP